MNDEAPETNLRCHECDTQLYFKKISTKYYVATCPNEKGHGKKVLPADAKVEATKA